MDWQNRMDELVPAVTDRLAACRHCSAESDKKNVEPSLAGQQAVLTVLEDLIGALFPGCHGHVPLGSDDLRGYVREKLHTVARAVAKQIEKALAYQCRVDHEKDCTKCKDCERRGQEISARFLEALPKVQETLQTDIVAAYEGDPAARSAMEIVQSYPGLHAITVHRIAHLLYREGVPLIPRIMSERAHSETGIDIHPGANIGKAFFIDHGTGVVVGETCDIGDHVKIYQGVTLGALSFEKDEQGRLVKGIKRHPNVGNGVVIYSGATILGGKTTIGEHSVIGGNVWLTHSVPPYSKVYNQQPRPLIKQSNGEWRAVDGPWTDVGGGI